MKKSMHTRLQPYGGLIFIFVGVNDEEITRYIGNIIKDKEAASEVAKDLIRSMKSVAYEGLTLTDDKRFVSCIYINEFKKNDPESMNTLSHEIFHAVDDLFEIYGLKLDRGSAEAYAHSIGWVTGEFFESIK